MRNVEYANETGHTIEELAEVDYSRTCDSLKSDLEGLTTHVVASEDPLVKGLKHMLANGKGALQAMLIDKRSASELDDVETMHSLLPKMEVWTVSGDSMVAVQNLSAAWKPITDLFHGTISKASTRLKASRSSKIAAVESARAKAAEMLGGAQIKQFWSSLAMYMRHLVKCIDNETSADDDNKADEIWEAKKAKSARFKAKATGLSCVMTAREVAEHDVELNELERIKSLTDKLLHRSRELKEVIDLEDADVMELFESIGPQKKKIVLRKQAFFCVS